MYEHLTTFLGGAPNVYHHNLYSQWANYGWGMIITGNVQVSRNHLSLGRDMIIPKILDEHGLRPFQDLANAIHGLHLPNSSNHNQSVRKRPVAIMQLNHSGRQSSNILGGRQPFVAPLAPSPLPVRSKSANLASRVFDQLMFQTPKEMTEEDIERVLNEFVRGAKLAQMAGFDGVELHVAHGCMSVLLPSLLIIISLF
jgi:2,4-dienoyl-CoA reductase-like NADH-dependent reductase (Old Yellow Enzyme family)